MTTNGAGPPLASWVVAAGVGGLLALVLDAGLRRDPDPGLWLSAALWAGLVAGVSAGLLVLRHRQSLRGDRYGRDRSEMVLSAVALLGLGSMPVLYLALWN